MAVTRKAKLQCQFGQIGCMGNLNQRARKTQLDNVAMQRDTFGTTECVG